MSDLIPFSKFMLHVLRYEKRGSSGKAIKSLKNDGSNLISSWFRRAKSFTAKNAIGYNLIFFLNIQKKNESVHFTFWISQKAHCQTD